MLETALRILLCIPARHIERLIRVNLERLGQKVDSAFDAEQCILKLSDAVYDCLLLDHDGLTSNEVEQIISFVHAHCPRTKIITIRDADGDDDSGNPPSYPTLQKPFNPQAILDLLR